VVAAPEATSPAGELARPGPVEPDALRRNLALDLTSAIGVGVSFGLVAGLLNTVARRFGMDPIGLAALAAAPFVANFLGMLAGRVGPRSPRQLALLRVGGAGLLVLLVFAPVPLAMMAVAYGYWLSYSLGLPFQYRLWGAIYPPRLRGRLLGVVGTGRAAAGGVAVLAAGLLADRLGGLPAVAIVATVAVVLLAASAGIRAPDAADPPRFSARQAMAALRARPGLRVAVVAQAFYGGGIIAAVPLYALVQVDRLQLSLGEVGVLGLLAAGSTTISYLAWGTLADRRGHPALLRGGSILGLLSLLAYTAAPSVALLWVAAVCAGLASAGIDLGLQSVILGAAESDERAVVMAGWNALTGLRGIAAPFVASGLVQLHLLDVTGALVVCGVVTAIGTLMYLRLDFSPDALSGNAASRRFALDRA
jgi:MFS family permease